MTLTLERDKQATVSSSNANCFTELGIVLAQRRRDKKRRRKAFEYAEL